MPRINLKPGSAEYADDTSKINKFKRSCEMPGCKENADFRAPKDRSLDGYYNFCLEHVQEYNKAWDYFSGMAQMDIEDHIIRSGLWDRPTWKYESFATLDKDLKKKTWQTYHFTEDTKEPPNEKQYPFEAHTPEFEAMAIMGLQPPLTLERIKTRYKSLVKKHHPDINRGNEESVELLKRINMAYTILKLANEKYETIETSKES